jgi:hypothetical protein
MITLKDIMKDVSGASFIGLDTVTTPVLTGGKANPMKGRVRKHMDGASVMVFQNKNSNGYENMVNRRLESEGFDAKTFNVGSRAWGERVEGLPIVTHKGADYLEVIFLKAGEVRYTLDGQPIEYADITGMKKAVAGVQGGLENKVIIRTFKADSIKTIRIDGQSISL